MVLNGFRDDMPWICYKKQRAGEAVLYRGHEWGFRERISYVTVTKEAQRFQTGGSR